MRFHKTRMVKRNLTILLSSALLFSSIIPALTGGVRAASAETAGITAVQEVSALSSFTAPLNEKIMAKSLSQGTVELELAGTLPLAAGYTVEQIVNGQTVMKSLSNVMIGAGNVTVYPNDAGQIAKLVIDGITPADRMRVGIRRDIANIADNTTFDHTKLDIQSADGYTLLDKKANITFNIPAAKLVTFTIVNGQEAVMMDGAELYRTANRLYATQLSPGSSLLQIMTFTRAQGNPLYRNTLEISLTAAKDKMRILNDITLEQYLYQVVPSEMPAFFGTEALKAQAVAARTYALTDYYSNRFADSGIHIDDSTLSQVFNNSAENAPTTEAVNATAGLIMKSGSELVDARFYSTSGGFGASKHEVWSDVGATTFPGTPIPYLIAKSYTYDKADPSRMLELNTSDEQAIKSFYKDLSYRGHDSESLYFRWKVGLTGTELQNTVNANLAGRYAADPAFILTQQPDGSFAQKAIPSNGIGTLVDMYVAKRGAGGNIMELVIAGTTGTYKIIKEFNIRFLIRPTKAMTGSNSDIIAYRAKGGATDYDPASSLKNPSILYSAFFTFDLVKDAGGAINNVTFFGGGNGHGVGMSQYGASMLGLSGWKFDQILNSYYSNMQLQTANGQPFEVQSLELSGLSPMNQEETKQAQVTAIYNDGSRVIWTAGIKFTSSNPAVAAVNKSGVVTALGYGQTEITASYGSKTASYNLAVASKVASLELSGLEPMVTGESRQAHVTAVKVDGTRASLTEGVTFTSSNPEAAAVDAAGWVNAVGHGQTIIAAMYEGRTASYTLEVGPALTGLSIAGPQSMKEAVKGQTVVSATYSDGKIVTVTEGVAYSSSNPAVATIDQAGVVTAVGMGETVITAAFSGKSAEYRLNVTATLEGITVSKLKQMNAGETEKMTVFALYSDNSSNEVTAGVSFSSSDPNVASIDSAGNIHAVGKGHTIITVTYAGKTASEKLGVQKAKNPNDSNDQPNN